jgi:hypothetical protein
VNNPAQIVVCKKHGKWQIRSQLCEEQSFDALKPAVRAAVDHANTSGKNGQPASVILHASGKTTRVWTYGEDAYPPELTIEEEPSKPALTH